MKSYSNELDNCFCIELCGGLGNQMFQYAFAKSISIQKNIPFVLDCNYFNYKPDIGNIPLPYELDVFELNTLIANNDILKKYNDSILAKINFKLNKLLNFPILFKSKRINENLINFDNINKLENIEGLHFSGYWQSENYFKNIENIIRKEFKFKNPLNNKNSSLKKLIQNTNSVSIHIRRGDYIDNPVYFKNHGVCSIDYYRDAIKEILIHIKAPKFFIFSNDFEWVKKNDFGITNFKFVDWNKGEDSYFDMQMMSLCKHNIIANSTFSWWGAWLNNNPSKLVISPKKWFANDLRIDDFKKIIPKNWVKI
jgi:hypothetical protein